MSELITPTDLASFLRTTVNLDSAETACRIASGWLASATKIAPWPPMPPPDDLWGWALELAALVYVNPQGVERATLGRLTLSWGAEAQARRQQILQDAQDAYAGANGTGPVGSFPDYYPYPDPALPYAIHSS